MPVRKGKLKVSKSKSVMGMKTEVVNNFLKKQMENPANASGNISKGVSPNNSVDKR